MSSPAAEPGLSLTRGGVIDRLSRALMGRGRNGVLATAAILGLLGWLPAAVLSLIELARGSRSALFFFTDLTTYARSLVSVPLLVIADWVVDLHVNDGHGRMRELIDPRGAARLEAMGETGTRLANNHLVEAVAGVLAVLPVFLRFTGAMQAGGEQWYRSAAGGGVPDSAAGYWYAFVGVPIFPFLLLLWVWRYAVWIWFLLSCSRLPLRLTASHPDHCAGLGFLEGVQTSFFPVVSAITTLLAAGWAEAIQSEHASSASFALPFTVYLSVLAAVFILPTAAFGWQLALLRVSGQRAFDSLVSRYHTEFEAKWVSPPASESPLGSPDIQSLNDMTGGFNTSHEMRVYLLSLRGSLPLLAAAILPMIIPLGASVPLTEIARAIVGHLV